MQNKKNLSKHLILALLIIAFAMSLCFNFALAQTTPVGNKIEPSASQSNQAKLPNPLGDDANDPKVLIGRIIGNILGYVGSVALLMFVIGGLMWMTSMGNEQRVKKGKDILTWSAFGLVIIFTAYALLKFVFDVLTK